MEISNSALTEYIPHYSIDIKNLLAKFIEVLHIFIFLLFKKKKEK